MERPAPVALGWRPGIGAIDRCRNWVLVRWCCPTLAALALRQSRQISGRLDIDGSSRGTLHFRDSGRGQIEARMERLKLLRGGTDGRDVCLQRGPARRGGRHGNDGRLVVARAAAGGLICWLGRFCSKTSVSVPSICAWSRVPRGGGNDQAAAERRPASTSARRGIGSAPKRRRRMPRAVCALTRNCRRGRSTLCLRLWAMPAPCAPSSSAPRPSCNGTDWAAWRGWPRPRAG